MSVRFLVMMWMGRFVGMGGFVIIVGGLIGVSVRKVSILFSVKTFSHFFNLQQSSFR